MWCMHTSTLINTDNADNSNDPSAEANESRSSALSSSNSDAPKRESESETGRWEDKLGRLRGREGASVRDRMRVRD